MQAYTRAMSHTDHTPSTAPRQPRTPLQKTTMTRLTAHLLALTTLLTLVLTITLPLAGLLTHPTPNDHTPTHTTHTTHTTHPSPAETPRISKADKAAAHADGCRQQPPTDDTLLARPSCRSGMPVTRDRMTLAPDTPHNNTPHTPTPAPMNEVPPAWSDHWGAAAHSPHHHSQA